MFLRTKIIKVAKNSNISFLLTKINMEIIKQIFDIKSMLGINAAGITNKLDNTYIILVLFNQECISKSNVNYIWLAKNQRESNFSYKIETKCIIKTKYPNIYYLKILLDTNKKAKK